MFLMDRRLNLFFICNIFSQLFSFARTTGLCFYMCKNKILLNCFFRKDDCIFFFHGQRPKTSSKLFPMQRRLNLFSCAKNYSIFYAKTTGSTPQRTAWPWPSSSTSSPGTSGGTRPKCIQAGHLIILLKTGQEFLHILRVYVIHALNCVLQLLTEQLFFDEVYRKCYWCIRPHFYRKRGYPAPTQDYRCDIAKLNGERHGEQREAGGGVAGRALATHFPPKSLWLEGH